MPEQDYFDTLYHHNDDPWGYTQRWYEQRKRQICLALLPRQRYGRILELGCANGVFSQELASRCDELLGLDANSKAVELARQRLKAQLHVGIQQKRIPQQCPEEKFDLIVISEIAYYLNENELLQLIEWAQRSLNDTGTLLCCHWRYPIDGFSLNGNLVHQLLKQHLKLYHYLGLDDPDFLVDLWTTDSGSLAHQEGLT